MTNLRLFQVCRFPLKYAYRLNIQRNDRKDIPIMHSTNLRLQLSVYILHSDYAWRDSSTRSQAGSIYSRLLLQICLFDVGQHDIVTVDEA